MIAYDDTPFGDHHQPDLAQVLGIPMEWFRELDRACDIFFAKRGMKPFLSARESIHLNAQIAMRKKEKAKQP